MKITRRVKQMLSWYEGETPGVKTNLARILMHGRLGGTGRMVILPVDQGWEHGPARSFAIRHIVVTTGQDHGFPPAVSPS